MGNDGQLIWSCEACQRPLDLETRVDSNGRHIPVRWLHTAIDSDDHEPVPVNRPATRPVCDLCGAADPGWIVPVKNVERAIAGAPALQPVNDVDAAWAACDACARMTASRDLNGIVSRYRRGPGPDAPVRLLRQHFETFLTSVIGPPHPA